MSQSPARHAAPNKARRGFAAVGVTSLALSGGAFALAGMNSADAAASATLNYSCTLKNFDTTFKNPWTVTLSADLPSTMEPGASLPAPAISATVVTGADASAQMRALDIKTVEGTAVAAYSVDTQDSKAALTIPTTNVPASGNLTTKATGQGEAFTAPSTPGKLTVKAGDFTSDLSTDTGFVIHLGCTPVSGSNTTIGTITVGGGAPAPTSSTTTPAPTTSTSSTPTTTPSSPSTTTSTTSSPSTSTSTTSTTQPTSSSSAPTTSTTTPASSTSTAAPTSSSSSAPTAPSITTAAPTPTASSTSGSATSSAAPAPAGDSGESSTQAPVETQAPGSGPKVDTDHVGAASANLAGIALASAGLVALGGAVIVGRRTN